MADMRDTFADTLVELGQEYDHVIVLDADLSTSSKTERFRRVFPHRFVQVGIAEQNLFGVAAGLAAEGYIPFPSTFAAFASRRACDQISISIAFPQLNVKIPGSYVGIPTSSAGASHNSVEDIAIMRSMPTMRVVDPADDIDLRAVMRTAVLTPGPIYFRVTRLAVPRLLDPSYKFLWGRGVTLRQGSDVTLVGTGMMSALCLKAAELLAAQGVGADVLHMGSIKPLDDDLLRKSASRTGAVVTAENASVIGGLGSAVAESLGEALPTVVLRIGVKDRYVTSGRIDELLAHHKMNPSDIAEAARQAMGVRDGNLRNVH